MSIYTIIFVVYLGQSSVAKTVLSNVHNIYASYIKSKKSQKTNQCQT